MHKECVLYLHNLCPGVKKGLWSIHSLIYHESPELTEFSEVAFRTTTTKEWLLSVLRSGLFKNTLLPLSMSILNIGIECHNHSFSQSYLLLSCTLGFPVKRRSLIIFLLWATFPWYFILPSFIYKKASRVFFSSMLVLKKKITRMAGCLSFCPALSNAEGPFLRGLPTCSSLTSLAFPVAICWDSRCLSPHLSPHQFHLLIFKKLEWQDNF